MISYKSHIPNHPATCKGVTGPVYTKNQCRLCWLAAYDRGYRKMWGINTRNLEVVKTPDEQYPCIYRGQEKFLIPGCSFCSGGPPARSCNHPQIQSRCVITGPDSFLNNARAKGYRVCDECGWRKPEEDLEMSLANFKQLLDQPPEAMPEGWKGWKVTPIAFRECFQELCKNPVKPPNGFSGRGIVIGAGGETYFKNAWCVAHHLRKHGCTLPIQFWYLGFQEMDPNMLEACKAVGIECVDATKVPGKKPRILAGWELKPFSVIHSPFEEVLYLDADSFPARNPEYLFDLPEYKELGAMFWPDLPPQGRTYWIPPDVWEQYGMLPDSGPDLESGQFIINKSMCWHELQVTMWLNEHSDWVYCHVYGDKSTYNLAWTGCDKDYVLPRKLPTWERPCIYQYDLEGEIVFQHACQGKQFLVNSVQIPALNNSSWPIEAMEELSKYWMGFLYGDPKTIELGKFTVKSQSEIDPELTFELSVELLARGYIRGGSRGFRRWYLNTDTEMFLIDKGKIAHTLKLDESGNWVGEKIALYKR